MILAIMNIDFNEACIVVSEDPELKNSTFGLDSGLASSTDVSQSMSGHSDSTRNLSALSSIRGPPPPVGEFNF